MKTLTEFNATTLKNAAKTRQELTSAGKTAEELPQALGEALKLEGDKLTFILGALEMVEGKTDDLKRVVVFTLAEGEKPPQGAVLKAEKYFAVEHYPPLHPPKARGRSDHEERGGRGDKRGRGGRDDKRAGNRDDKRSGGRGPGPKRDGEQPLAAAGGRPPRQPRPPRAPEVPRDPSKPFTLPKPLDKPKTETKAPETTEQKS